MKIKQKKRTAKEKKLLKLDLGCGQNKREGFTGVDIAKAPGVDVVHDLLKFPWPFAAGSVDDAHCSHFFEHIPNRLRMPFMDELARVLIPGGRVTIICPNWTSVRAYQDPTHEWPPIGWQSFFYFNKGWRVTNKLDHYPVKCDFDFSFSHNVNPVFSGRSQEFLQASLDTMLNVALDVIVTLTKRPEADEAHANV